MESARIVAAARPDRPAMSASPRSSPRTRSRPRCEQWPDVGRPGQPGRVADGDGEAPRHRRAAAGERRSTARRPSSGARPRRWSRESAPDLDAAIDNARSATTCCAWCSSAATRCCRADARVALTLRLLGGLPHRRDRPRVPRARRDDRPAHRPRQADARRSPTCPFEVPPAPSFARASRLGPRGRLPHLQRGLHRDLGRRLDAPRAVRGRAAAGPRPGRPGAGRGGGARAGRADGDPGVAAAGAHRARTGAPILLLEQDRGRWDRLLIGRGLAALARAEALGGAARPVRAPGGDRRLPRPGADAPTRPTGRASSRCTTRSAGWRRHRSWSSTGPWRSAMAGGPAAGAGARRRRGGGPARWRGYHLLPAVRADLLSRLGRDEEAVTEFVRAASMARNAAERTLLLERAQAASRASVHGGRATSPG